jgi:hypothetical protein
LTVKEELDPRLYGICVAGSVTCTSQRDRSKEHAPGFRKGEPRVAIELEFERLGLEPKIKAGEPVEATGVDDLLAKLAEKALRTLESDLGADDMRARQEAARTIVQAWSKAKQDEAAKAEPSQEEREAQLAAALQSPRLREFLEARGWRKAEP